MVIWNVKGADKDVVMATPLQDVSENLQCVDPLPVEPRQHTPRLKERVACSWGVMCQFTPQKKAHKQTKKPEHSQVGRMAKSQGGKAAAGGTHSAAESSWLV